MIHKIVEAISNQYDFPSGKIRPINCCFYEYTVDGQDYILRVIDHRTREELEAELHWVNYLADHGTGVARAVPSITGSLIDPLTLDDKTYFVTPFEKAKGSYPTCEKWNSNLFQKIGRLIGKMHRLTSTYTPVGFRKEWPDEDICDYDKYLPSSHTHIRLKCKEAIEAVKALPKDKDTYGIIHSDIHQMNLHLYNGELTLFDFDDCEQHYFINDLAIVLYWGLEVSFNGTDIDTYATALIQNLFEGYRQEYRLDPFWVEQIPEFLKLREVLSFIDCHREWDMENLHENQKIILNHYRKNIESERPFLDINFMQFINCRDTNPT